MNIPNETIVKFKNGTELHMPSGIYEKISFDKDSIIELKWEENDMDYKVQFLFDDVLYIAETIQSTSKKNQVFKAIIDGKSIAECVSDGITSAVQKSIRDTDVED